MYVLHPSSLRWWRISTNRFRFLCSTLTSSCHAGNRANYKTTVASSCNTPGSCIYCIYTPGPSSLSERLAVHA